MSTDLEQAQPSARSASARPVPRTRLSRVGLAARLALTLFVLPLSLVLTSSGSASALVAAPAPVQIGQSIKTIPVGSTVKGVGRSIPFVRTAMSLLSLYSVADTVLDLPGSNPNGGTDQYTDNSSRTTGSCQVSISGVSYTGRTVSGSQQWTGCADRSTAAQIDWLVVNCRLTTEGATPRFQTGSSGLASFQPLPTTGNVSGSVTFPPLTVCPAGSVVQGVTGRAKITGTSPGGSPTVSMGDPYPDEDYRQETTVQCRRGDGSIVSITESLVGYPGKVVVPSCEDRVPGSIPWGVTAKGGPDGGTTEPLLEITPDRDALTKYPDCFANGALTCVVRVHVGGQPCAFGMPGCLNWREDLDAEPGADIRCKFGPYVVPITTCAPLRRSYRKAGPGTLTGGGTASDPEVSYPPRPGDYPEPGGSPNPNPNPEPNPNPTAGSNPTAGPNPEAAPAPNAPPTGEGPEGDGSSCWGTGWSWNPVSWVVIPVKCSLKWAFVPRSSAMRSIADDLSADWRSSSPGQWSAAATALVPTGTLAGCQGPRLRFAVMGIEVDSRPFDACDGWAANAAAVVRTAASLFIVAGGFFASLRAIGAGFGWRPGVGENL